MDARPATLQTDFFCAGCNYNLVGLPTFVDDRYGLALVRCPECGKHHAAGERTTVFHGWLGRLVALGLVLWVILLLAATAANLGLTCAMTAAFHEVVNDVHVFDTRNYDADPTLFVWTATVTVGVLLALLAGSLGVTWAVVAWHLRPSWAAWVPPALSGAAVAFVAWMDWANSVRWGAPRYVAVEMPFVVAFILVVVGGWLGARFGRPVARGLARLLVPPRPRQWLAFLWTADGLPPPSVGPAARCAAAE